MSGVRVYTRTPDICASHPNQLTLFHRYLSQLEIFPQLDSLKFAHLLLLCALK